MPVRPRQPSAIAQQLVPLLLLGIGLFSTNNAATFLDGESMILGAASNPLRKMLGLFFSAAGMRGQPPLHEIILHFWLRMTGGSFDYLRIPSILFFLAGLFLLGRSCRHLAGSSSAGVAVIWVGVLWPVGYLLGRLATSSSFSFFLVAGLTLSYFKYLEDQTTSRWAAFFFFCVFLIWTSYFGWAILACLAIDQFLRWRAKESSGTPKALLGTATLLLVSFLPLFPALRSDLSNGMNLHQGALTILATAGFHVFSLFVSESVAPWYWRLSVPAGLAVLLCLGLVAWRLRGPARRLLFYSMAILVVMALLGILQTQSLFMLSPWVLLPVGVAIDTAKPRWATFALAAALLIIGAAGWYGIYSRRYYSAPQFIEPWQEVAGDAASKIRGGATVISDRPSFLFYLTYLLRVPSQNGPWRFEGLLPDSVKHPQVYSPAGWLAAGHPTGRKMILVRRGGDSGGDKPMDDAARQLDQSCGSISSRLRMRDEGYKWKQRFSPHLGEPQWRIEIREYDCDASNSKQIYPLPPR
ncbi:MAG: glycosyltransferase family 39 protein [Candidatus Acidiferrales bacterium]